MKKSGKKNGFHFCGIVLAAYLTVFAPAAARADYVTGNFYHHAVNASDADGYVHGIPHSDITPYFHGNGGDTVRYYEGIINSGPVFYYHGGKSTDRYGYAHGNAGNRVFFHGTGQHLTR